VKQLIGTGHYRIFLLKAALLAAMFLPALGSRSTPNKRLTRHGMTRGRRKPRLRYSLRSRGHTIRSLGRVPLLSRLANTPRGRARSRRAANDKRGWVPGTRM
jgi:hypothetical protein